LNLDPNLNKNPSEQSNII